MSFSVIVKDELCRMVVSKECCLKAELTAIFADQPGPWVKGLDHGGEHGVGGHIATENAALARRVFSTVKELYGLHPRVIIRKSKKLKRHTTYIIELDNKKIVPAQSGNQNAKESKPKNQPGISQRKNCCMKAFLRGAFLSGGSISDPEKTYHLEITCKTTGFAIEVQRGMAHFGLNGRRIKRKNEYVVYIKEGENIVDFLNVIGAHHALLELENVRIIKEMRNNVNRIVNCETANLGKTVDASIRQIQNIEYLKKHTGLENLPKGLREIAFARLDNSEANLSELGQMLSPPLGKSGVYHRLHKLDVMAGEERLKTESAQFR